MLTVMQMLRASGNCEAAKRGTEALEGLSLLYFDPEMQANLRLVLL
jgi:hypothetical protein